ncbi:TonB-dependent receptor [Silvibacterium dinghuense]|nr:carboxypeptidase regulatory-like domain-containing protein [Silvibacterium dinghuense]GGH09120.1 hypothetical protein GCM10011586_26970 [Silvibacterium dinghuense]
MAQEVRSTIAGHVSDSTGARVPGAQITVRNTDTGVVTTVKTNETGDYTVPFLQQGTYDVIASEPGFKATHYAGLLLSTEQTLTENIVLAIGNVSETVTVASEGALIDTATAETGQTLTAKEVEDLPSNGRSPLGFARDEYGVVSKGKHSQAQTRPFDNSAADDFSLGGGNSASNELLLNGVPNMQDSSRTAGYSPQLDSVDAVHVDEFTSDASFGDTSGGTVNITTKPGTNTFHGSASEYYSGSRPLTAEPYFTTQGASVSSTHFNQFGGAIGGPVYIPHVFDGHNRVFFEYAFEGYIGALPSTFIGSVPTEAERKGDFSSLLAVSPEYQLYNPYDVTATTANGKTTYTRAAINDNIMSNAGLSVNSVGENYLALFPSPNYSGPSTKDDGTNNFFASDPTQNNYKSNALRVDVAISQANKIYGEVHRSTSYTNQSNVFHSIATGTSAEVLLWGGSIDDTHTFNSTTFLDTRLGFSRSINSSNPNSYGTDPTTLGFPSYIRGDSTAYAIPRLTFSDDGYSNIPSISSEPGSTASYDSIQLFASLNKSIGRHTIKIGPDIRANKDSVLSPGNADGDYSFSTGSTDFLTSGSTGTVQPFGSTFAMLYLGLPSSGSYDVNTKFQYNNWYNALFIQDDWKIRPNLTASLGLRLEHETPVNESNNKMTTAWDPNVENASSSAAAAAYAADPSLLPVADFKPTGGLYYANSSDRHAYHTAPLYLGPRLGLAYSPELTHGTTAIRLGWGVFENPFNNYYQGQTYGYSQTTSMIVSNDSNQTVATTLSDPFPTASNPIVQPAGAAWGINTNLGSKMVFYGNIKVPYAMRSSLDIQQQFGKNWMLDIGYINTHQVHLSYSNTITGGSGSVPVSYLSRSRYYDAALTAEYNTTVANPYKGTLVGPGATTGINTASTLSVSQLLWPYSEYSSVTQQLVPYGNANYNALLIRLEKRMANGLDLDVNYTYSRNLGAESQLNTAGALWYGETASDFPHSLHLTAIYQLPFGKGRAFLGNASKLVDEALGGWELSTIYSFDSGTPYSWGNVIYNGNWHDIDNNPHNAKGEAFNTKVFDTRTCENGTTTCNNTVGSSSYNPSIQPNAYNNRTFPLYAWRADPTNNWDFSMLKNFRIHDRLQIQPRIDAFNIFNRVQFSAPNLSPTSSAFGTITAQQNTNRQLQGGIHILF